MKPNHFLTGLSLACVLGSYTVKAQALPQPLVVLPIEKALFVLTDGQQEKKLAYTDQNTVQAEQIDSINVLKDKQLLTPYGEEGKYGVVRVYVNKQYFKEFIKKD